MINDLEQKLIRWSQPLSESEDLTCERAVNMVKDKISSSDLFKRRDIEIFAQGSYANNTNVRTNSDVDLCVLCKQTFKYYVPTGKQLTDFGYGYSDYSYDSFKMELFNLISEKFGITNITYGKKSIKVMADSYHKEIDIVPFFEYKVFDFQGSVVRTGVAMEVPPGITVENYPKQHIRCGKNKNIKTNYNYKKMVRCFKAIKYQMEDDGYIFANIKSFVVESVLFNLDNSYFDFESNSRTYFAQFIKEPHKLMFYLCLVGCKHLLTNPANLKEANNILNIFDNPDRNAKEYLDYFESIDKYCFGK